MTWVKAGRIEAIPARGARTLRVGEERIALFRTGRDEVYALRDACPHRGGPLSQGIVHGQCVTCPLHDWVIDLATGNATGADEGSAQLFGVQVRNGIVYVEVPQREAVPRKTEASGALLAT